MRHLVPARVILSTLILLQRARGSDDTAAWEQFEAIEETGLEQIADDIRNYQTVGICGTSKNLPNSWIYQNTRKKRETQRDSQNEGGDIADGF